MLLPLNFYNMGRKKKSGLKPKKYDKSMTELKRLVEQGEKHFWCNKRGRKVPPSVFDIGKEKYGK